jgi:hypothetical protein
VTDLACQLHNTVRLNLGAGHHHQHLHRTHHITESGRSTTTTRLITIPVVGSLTPYTVISQNDGDDANNGTISVTLPSDMGQEQEQVELQGELISSPPTTSQQHQHQQLHPQTANSHVTWEEAVAASILPVRCKDTNAELYKGKFGSGNKGKCIKFANEWYTPTEFEALCGRGNSKDWKRSIRFGGRTLQTLIDKGHLVPHASSCICSNCVDDATATGPIRPFTPYQRKRKGQNVTEHVKGTKLERLTSKDSTTDESSDIGTPITPLGVANALNPLTQALMKINHISLPSCTQEAWKVVEDAVDSLSTATASLKAIVQEMRDRTNQEVDNLRSQLQNSVQTTLVQNPVVGHPQILRIFDSNRIQTYSIEVLDPDSFKPMQSNSSSLSKCENCGRDGSLECSGCHVVHYCSSFCQKKDWPLHQAACQDQLHVECKEEPDLDMK